MHRGELLKARADLARSCADRADEPFVAEQARALLPVLVSLHKHQRVLLRIWTGLPPGDATTRAEVLAAVLRWCDDHRGAERALVRRGHLWAGGVDAPAADRRPHRAHR